MRNTTKKKIAPIVVTVLVLLYAVPLAALALWAAHLGSEAEVAAWPLLLGYAFLGGAVVVGILKALFQRLREIDGGEEEDASQY